MPEDTERSPTQSLERKLATILSADVAEYSRLMAEDEEGTLRTFRTHKEVFDQLVSLHRGRVFNTAGDAILAEFTSAVEAVRCATEIQAALRTRNDQLPPSRQVRFRIGVNLGDVMVHGSDLLGDGVNVAARLQGAAEPGGVCVSGSVYDQIRNKLSLTFASLGEQSFKNIPQPVRTFSIVESETDGVFPSPPAGRRSGAGRAVMALAAAALLLLVIGGGYWGYGEWQRGKAEQARILAEVEATRQEAARRDAQITAERAKAEQLLRAADADKKRTEVEAQRATEELRKKEAAPRQVAAVQPPPQPSPAAAAPRAPGSASLDGLYAGPLCYGPTAAKEQTRCYRAQAFVADGRITGRWSNRNSSATTILSGLVSASGDVQIEIFSENADKPRLFTINLAGSLHDGRLDATGSFVNGRLANLHWQRQ